MMLGVSAAATMATSREIPSVDEQVDGIPLLLSPDNRTVLVEFEFDASDVALEKRSALGVSLRYRPLWLDVEEPIPELRVDAVKLEGPELSEAPLSIWDHRVSCGARPECVGRYQVAFHWPDDRNSGAVRVDWHVEASVSFDTDTVPEGAEVRLTADEPANPGVLPTRVHEDMFRVQRTEPASLQRVAIEFQQPLPSNVDVGLELEPLISDVSQPGVTVYLRELTEIRELVPSTGSGLHLPDECRSGPCSISFDLGAMFSGTRRGFSAQVVWALTTTDPSIPVEIETTSVAIPTATSKVDLPAVRLSAETPTQALRLRITVTSETLPSEELAEPGVLLVGHLALNPDPNTLHLNDQARLDADITFLESETHPISASRYTSNIIDNAPVSFLVPNECSAEQDCEISVEVGFEAALLSAGASADLEPSLEFELFYPRTLRVPPRATVVVEVGS